MDTTFLNTLFLTVDTGSMAEAARRLDLSPAAVAQQIRSLERDFGVPLVRRSGRTVRPTEAGIRIVERSRVLMRDLADLKAEAADDAMTGDLRVGVINTALQTLMPEILSQISRTHPGLRVYIQSALSAELFNAVQRGDLDAAICLEPQFAFPKTCVWQLLREESLVLLAPLNKAGCDPHELLRTMPFIRYDRSQWGGQKVDRYLRCAGIIPRERFELSCLTAMAALVAKELGVALVPDTGAQLALNGNTTKILLPHLVEPRRLGIVRLRSPVHRKLIEFFVEQAKIASCY
jgi:DNA-binding transcriptional LysR family regulator